MGVQGFWVLGPRVIVGDGGELFCNGYVADGGRVGFGWRLTGFSTGRWSESVYLVRLDLLCH